MASLSFRLKLVKTFLSRRPENFVGTFSLFLPPLRSRCYSSARSPGAAVVVVGEVEEKPEGQTENVEELIEVVMASENDFPSPPLSPETDEFVNLERRLAMAEEDEEAMGDDGDRSELPDKLEERRQSQEDSSSLQLTERRQLRQFSRADEYLYAMKEDLSEWLNLLYPHVEIDADNFLDRLETGEHLVKVGRQFYLLVVPRGAKKWN